KIRMSSADQVNYTPETDCNDIQALSAKGQGKITKVASKLSAVALKKCEGQASAPATLGFVSCGAPCDTVAITSSYATVAACLVCQIESLAVELNGDLFGALPAPPVQPDANSVVKCQSGIAAIANKLAFTAMKQQQKCQFAEDIGLLSANCKTD